MDWFADNWPALLIGLGIFVVVSGLVRRVAKLAFLGVALGVIGLVVWPMLNSSI